MRRRMLTLQAPKQAANVHQVHDGADKLSGRDGDKGEGDEVFHGHLTVELSGAHADV